MVASELRLGNYLYDEDEDILMQVSRVETNEYTDWNSGDEYNVYCLEVGTKDNYYEGYFRPIRIKEEWLLKLGFVKIPDFGPYSNIWNLNGFMVSLGDYINIHIDWADDGDGFHPIKCYEELFIHQLQNLYFELIGKELKIEI